MAIRKRLMLYGGIVVGVLTLRRLRKRRRASKEPGPDHEELETASDHANAAVEHAKVAAKMAAEERQQS